MKQSWALVSDFDGTISDDDFFWHIVDRWFDVNALHPWQEYRQGKISHLNALNAIFSQIRLPEAELLAFIDTIRLDPYFAQTAELCRQKSIPLYIVSAGCDYYINRLIGSLIERYEIKLVTNRGEYDPARGLVMIPPQDGPFYDPSTGVDKPGVVRQLQLQGFSVVMAGDGPPDFPAARLAEVVFAKKDLLESCRQANIKTRPFADFQDVNRFLSEV